MRATCHYKSDPSLAKKTMDIGYRCCQCGHGVVLQVDIQPPERQCPEFLERQWAREEREREEAEKSKQ